MVLEKRKGNSKLNYPVKVSFLGGQTKLKNLGLPHKSSAFPQALQPSQRWRPSEGLNWDKNTGNPTSYSTHKEKSCGAASPEQQTLSPHLRLYSAPGFASLCEVSPEIGKAVPHKVTPSLRPNIPSQCFQLSEKLLPKCHEAKRKRR